MMELLNVYYHFTHLPYKLYTNLRAMMDSTPENVSKKSFVDFVFYLIIWLN